jgi:hypothetical protein
MREVFFLGVNLRPIWRSAVQELDHSCEKDSRLSIKIEESGQKRGRKDELE